MSKIIEIKYYNAFWLKKLDGIVNHPDVDDTTWPMPEPPKYEFIPFGIPSDDKKDWYIEESRIHGGYNNTSVDLGVRAYIVDDDKEDDYRPCALIYSGVYNSITGINNINQFSIGENIITELDPKYNSIQLLYAEDTNLIIFQEDKVSRALVGKSAIYSAEGDATVTSSHQVIGQIVTYAGEYGISTNPESFSVYGYRKYFADKRRNVILRLSLDGITEVSNYGMIDFFKDELSTLPNNGKIVGGFDIHGKKYDISLRKNGTQSTKTVSDEYIKKLYKTLGFDEIVLGWTSFYSYAPDFIKSLKNKFYSFKNGKIYEHYNEDVSRGTFYDNWISSSVKFIMNPNPSIVKSFKTINYEGSSNWKTTEVFTNYGDDTGKKIKEYIIPTSLSNMENMLFDSRFKKKENKYFSNIYNNSSVNKGEIISGNKISGLRGVTLTINMETAEPSLTKNYLFAVSTDYVDSSY